MKRALTAFVVMITALLSSCAHLGHDAEEMGRPEVRYYLIADT